MLERDWLPLSNPETLWTKVLEKVRETIKAMTDENLAAVLKNRPKEGYYTRDLFCDNGPL